MMPRNRRGTAANDGNPTAGVFNVAEALRLQSLASPAARLVQCCYVDHSTPQFASPHIHLQLLYSDRSRTPWFDVQSATVHDLQAALENLGGPRVRLHAHEQGDSAAPNGGAANPKVVGALPTCTLSEAGACRLAADGFDACPFCLDGFAAAEVVLFMPCGHVAHGPCALRWLKIASTCPTCRFALPKAPTKADLEELLGPARREQKRIEEAKMSDDGVNTILCQEAAEDEEGGGSSSVSGSASPITTSDSLEMTPPASRQHSRPLSPPMSGPPRPRNVYGGLDEVSAPVAPATQPIAVARSRGSVRSGLGAVTRRLFHLGPTRSVRATSSSSA